MGAQRDCTFVSHQGQNAREKERERERERATARQRENLLIYLFESPSIYLPIYLLCTSKRLCIADSCKLKPYVLLLSVGGTSKSAALLCFSCCLLHPLVHGMAGKKLAMAEDRVCLAEIPRLVDLQQKPQSWNTLTLMSLR